MAFRMTTNKALSFAIKIQQSFDDYRVFALRFCFVCGYNHIKSIVAMQADMVH